MKRTDYINWDEYFMGIALLTAMRSKDPSSQVYNVLRHTQLRVKYTAKWGVWIEK